MDLKVQNNRNKVCRLVEQKTEIWLRFGGEGSFSVEVSFPNKTCWVYCVDLCARVSER